MPNWGHVLPSRLSGAGSRHPCGNADEGSLETGRLALVGCSVLWTLGFTRRPGS